MPATLAYFGIQNDGVNLAINLLILFLVIIWLALVYWTRTDAKRRIADPVLVLCATASALFPFIGTIVYMIVRPPEYIDDRRGAAARRSPATCRRAPELARRPPDQPAALTEEPDTRWNARSSSPSLTPTRVT